MNKKCLVCEKPIPPRTFQDPTTVRACDAICAVRLFKREHPQHAEWNKGEGAPS